MKQQQLEFTYMRAIAIMMVVAGHSIYQSEHGFPPLLENVIKGSTALFVFISGYFYHRVFFPRKQFLDFMQKRKKAKKGSKKGVGSNFLQNFQQKRGQSKKGVGSNFLQNFQ